MYNKIRNANGKYFTFNFGIEDYSDLYVFVNGEYTDSYIFSSSLNSKTETSIYFNKTVKGTIEAIRIRDAEKLFYYNDSKVDTLNIIDNIKYIYSLISERAYNREIFLNQLRQANELIELGKVHLKHINNVNKRMLECDGSLIPKKNNEEFFGILEEQGQYFKLPDLSFLNYGSIIKPYIIKKINNI